MKILIKNQQRYQRLNKTKIIRAARKILSLLEQPTAELSILFVGDKKMMQLNTLFRGVPKSTDVLSFDAKIPVRQSVSNPILGDIVINMHRAVSQAKIAGTGVYEEIYRLLIHGVLHLLGYDHEKSRYKAQVMRKKEEEIFNAFKKIF
jgi:probable rRNA maturation factor